MEQQRNKTIINEGGLNRLILRSRTPQAEKFQDWVTDKILPQIRKTGSCSVTPDTTTDQKLLTLAQGVIELTAWKQQAQPKVAYYDTYVTSEGLLTLTDAARKLGITPNQFFSQLHHDRVLSHIGTVRNKAFQRYIDDGYFVLNGPADGNARTWPQTMVTAKGLIFLTERYGRPDKEPTMSATPSA